MAFSMSGMAGAVGGGNSQARQADQLPEIETEHLGFAAIAGRSSKTKVTTKLKLLPSPWSPNDLPPPEANLFAVASKKGIAAAAGPDCLVIASTDSIRAALLSTRDDTEDPVAPFTPQLTIPLPRLSQVAFTSDENYLVISAQQGGGLAIHEVASLLQGNTSSAFQLATEGVGVRSLVPNPAPELGENVAVVLEKGQLMIANLKERSFIKAQNGAVLKDNVSCVTWSNRGKQLVAGLGDGTSIQMKPDGSPQALIPRPPALEVDSHVSAISWLTNDEFLFVHTPNNIEPDTVPDVTYHFVSREKGSQNFTFHPGMLSACAPFGMARFPPHYFVVRLRNWKPALDDCVMIASSASTEFGVVTKSSQPLSRDTPVTNAYAETNIADDGRKATMPNNVDEEYGLDSSAIGVAVDLSTKEKVYRPIKGSDLEWSETPLPALMALNQEGFLNAWWVVYNASVEAGVAYEGLTSTGTQPAAPQQQSQPAAPAATSAFGQSGGSAFGRPAFGGSGFGNASPMGQSKSPWASTSTGSATSAPAFGQTGFAAAAKPGAAAFGKPAFGSPSQPGTGSAFGSAGGMGQKASPWGSAASTPSQIPKPTGVFGGSTSSESGFAKFGSNTASASPFASAAAKSGQQSSPFGAKTGQQSASPFGGMGASKPGQSAFGSGGSSFGQPGTPNQSFGLRTEPSFGSTVSLNSTTGGSTIKSPSFGTPAQPSTSVFGQAQKPAAPPTQESDMGDADDAGDATPKEQPKPSPFGLSSSGFKLGTTFKGDGSAKDDLPKPEGGSGSFGLGSALGSALEDTPKKEEKSDPKTPNKFSWGGLGQTQEKPKDTSTTPTASEKEPPKAGGGLFGGFNKSTSSASPFASTGSLFGKPAEKAKSPTPEVKEEDSKLEAAPLPPDFITKPPKKDDFKPEDAPLPPDFSLPKGKKDEKEEEDLPPIAGSPPIKVEKPDSPSLSEIPEKKDQPPAPAPAAAPAAPNNNTWSFPPIEKTRSDSRPLAQPKSRSPSRSPVRSPSRNAFGASMTPAGAPRQTQPTPIFSPPSTSKASEPFRSPSPVRAFSTSVLSPGPRRQAVTIPPPTPVSRATSRLAQPPEQDPVFNDLVDDQEFEATHAVLSSSPRAKRTLEEFYVHQDYAGKTGPSSVPGSIEQLYRDMQSMIDTVGLNAHNLAGFVKGHNEISHEERTRQDLDIDIGDPEENDWVLAEIEDLSKVENGMERSLDSGRIGDVQNKIRDLIRLSKDVGQLRRRLNDVRKSIEQRRDPSKLAVTRATPLTEEQGAQQASLRTAFAETQKLLAQAEEGIVLLKTRIATAQASKAGTPGGSTGPTPTAEAVENTIRKMTAMVEQKSGDLDVLENQLRRFRLLDDGSDDEYDDVGADFAEPRTPVYGYGDEHDEDMAAGLGAMTLRSSGRFGSSRENSPAVFATPPSKRHSLMASRSREGTPFSTGGKSGRGLLFYTPDRSSASYYGRSPSPGVGLRGSVGPVAVVQSVEDGASGAGIINRDEVRGYVRKVEKKRVVQGRMREAVLKRGPRVTRISRG